MSERELLDKVVAELQAHYGEHQKVCFYLKLEKCAAGISQLAWIKVFKNAHDLAHFFFDTVTQKASIIIAFHQGGYEILCWGHYHSNRFKVWRNKIDPGYPTDDSSGSRETRLMIPRELLMKGFSEITDAVSNSKRSKAV